MMQTPLDAAHAAMVQGQEGEALAFYRLLADAPLLVALPTAEQYTSPLVLASLT